MKCSQCEQESDAGDVCSGCARMIMGSDGSWRDEHGKIFDDD